MTDEQTRNNNLTDEQERIYASRERLENRIKEIEALAKEYGKKSRRMVNWSIGFDALTVVLSTASPALTTYVAYEDNIDPVMKLGVILVVATAVSLPVLKRILGIKKLAIHNSASAMDLHKAISEEYDQLSRIQEDIKENKQERYYMDRIETLNSKVSDVKQNSSNLVFDIMEESHGIAAEESIKVKKENEYKSERPKDE